MKTRVLVSVLIVVIVAIAAWLWRGVETPRTTAERVQAPVEITTPAPPSDAAPKPASTPFARTTPVPAWENQIDQVLRSNVTETQTAQILLNMLPTLPEEGQIEAANHITNLLPDGDYEKAKPVLLNPNTPEPVLSVFFTDLMNRPDPTKLRTFLEVAKISNHAFHEEALSDLEIFVGDDYGSDWIRWSAAVEKYLKESAAQ